MKHFKKLFISSITVGLFAATPLLVAGASAATPPSKINFASPTRYYNPGTTIMMSSTGKAKLVFKSDCNLVLYKWLMFDGTKGWHWVWQTHTGGRSGNCYVRLGGSGLDNHIHVVQRDTAGNFDLYHNHLADPNTGNPQQLVLTSTGNLIQYSTDNGYPVRTQWQTNT